MTQTQAELFANPVEPPRSPAPVVEDLGAGQVADIYRHLRRYGSITPLEALELYGCFRLSARIFDLRHKGARIVTDRVTTGRKPFARYRLERGGRQ